MKCKESGVKGVNWTHFCHSLGAIETQELDHILLDTLINTASIVLIILP